MKKISDKKRRQINIIQAVKVKLYERCGGLCEIRFDEKCKEREFHPDWRGLHPAHIIGAYAGGEFSVDNILMGCLDCHDHNKYPNGLPIPISEAQELVKKLNKKLREDRDDNTKV